MLNHSNLDFRAPAFFSCLGVLVYLPEDSITAIFQLIASFPRRSEVVLSFSQGNRSTGEQSSGVSSLARAPAAAGEPWRTYYDPAALCRELSQIGFSQVSLLSPEEAQQVYYRDRRDALPPPRRSTIARAIV